MKAPDTVVSGFSALRSRWLAFLVGILLCTLVVILWWMLGNKKNADYHTMVEIEARKLTSYIQADLRNRIPALQRIVNRWEFRKGLPRDEFINDIQAYIYDMPGFQAISWVDEGYHVRWIAPISGNEQAQGLNLAFEENRRLALEKAKSRRSPTMTSPIDLVQGGKGFLVYFPIFVEGNFNGFVLATFRTQEWLTHIFNVKSSPRELRTFKIAVAIDDAPVFQDADWSVQREAFESTAGTDIMEHRFIVRARPTRAFFEENASPINEVVIAGGFLLSILAAFMIHLSQRASEERWKTEAAKQSLETAVNELQQTRGDLQLANDRLTLATRAGNIGIWTWEIEANRLTWNEIMYALYDVPLDIKPDYDTWKNRLHPDDAESAEAMLMDAVAGKAAFDCVFRLCLPGDTVRHIRAAARVVRDRDGKPTRVTGVNWDITPIKQAEEQLATESRRLSDILEGTNVGTWEWNVQTGEVVFNERWAEIIGYTLKELEPLSIDTWMKFANPDDLKKSEALLDKHFNGELDYYECEARMRHKDGSWRWVLDRGKVASWTEDGKPLLMSGTHQDITERKLTEKKIRHLATHDMLTNLPTLKLAQFRAKQAIQIAQRNQTHAAVLFVDLDGFKKVNDTLGHDAGNVLLKEIASRLAGCARAEDTVARIGGDEFLIVLTELRSPADAALVAKKAVAIVTQPVAINEMEASVGASIGIAIYPIDGQGVESLLRQADDAMYKVKESGKNGYAFATPPQETLQT